MADIATRRPRISPDVARRSWAYAVSLVVILAMLYPVLGSPQSDSFPLSTYPMFSGRKSANTSIAHVIGFTAAGERVVLPPEAVANDEVVQAYETIRQAIRQGDEAVAALCEDAAYWAAEHLKSVTSVVVVTDEYDAVHYFEGQRDPLSTQTHANCGVSS